MRNSMLLHIAVSFFCLVGINAKAQTTTMVLSNTVGEVNYESKDHRANVYEVISDRKIRSNNQFQGVIIAATDYYPYGSEIGARSFSGDYKYGFQGQEKDEEAKGKGNSINYKYRMHDARVGRFFAVDPLSDKYPYNSNYAFSENNLIHAVELEGMEKIIINTWNKSEARKEQKVLNFTKLNEKQKIYAISLLKTAGFTIYYSDFKKAEKDHVWEYTVDGDGIMNDFTGNMIHSDVIKKYDSMDEYLNWKNKPKSVETTGWWYTKYKSLREYDKSLDGDIEKGALLMFNTAVTILTLGEGTIAIQGAKTIFGKLMAGAALTWKINDLTSFGNGETILEKLSKEISNAYGGEIFKAVEGTVEIYDKSKALYKFTTWDYDGNKYKVLWDASNDAISGTPILMSGGNGSENQNNDEN